MVLWKTPEIVHIHGTSSSVASQGQYYIKYHTVAWHEFSYCRCGSSTDVQHTVTEL